MIRPFKTNPHPYPRIACDAAALGLCAISAIGGAPSAQAVQITSERTASASSLSGVTVTYSRADGTLWRYAVTGDSDEPLGNGRWPRLSPDSARLMYLVGDPMIFGNAELYTRPISSTQATHVFDNQDWTVGSNWVPNSQAIVFDYLCSLYRSAPDGTGLGTISGADCFDDAPAIDPVDPTRLAFHNTNQGIGLMSATGTGRHLVPNTQVGDMWPTWSPDGQSLAFMRSGPTPTVVNGIYLGKSLQTIKPDGAGLLQLLAVTAPGDKIGYGGGWTGDGKWYVVSATLSGVAGLYAVATDGSGAYEQLDLSTGAAPDFVGSVSGPSWRIYLSELARP